MGKSLPKKLTRIDKRATEEASHFVKPTKPPPPRISAHRTSKSMESSGAATTAAESDRNVRVPLSEVVSECVKRWFRDTLKEAKAGDINMQVLVAQMYQNGYGVSRDAQKGRAWMSRASRIRPSVWKVSDKRPGYNASDSDSDELEEDS